MYNYIFLIIFEVSRGEMAQACDYKCDKLWVRFPLDEMEYFNIVVSWLLIEQNIEEKSIYMCVNIL